MKKGFTITELVVAVGLLAAVLAAAGMIFNYSIDAQRTAAATAEIMRTLRSITGQLNIDLEGLAADGYLVLWSDDSNSALYFFSTGDFQSWYDSERRSNIARLYFGPAQNDPNILALDTRLLTPDYNGLDCSDANFAACQVNIRNYFEEPCDVLTKDRPDVDMNGDPNDARRLLASRVSSLRIEWTADSSSWTNPNLIEWFGWANRNSGAFENPASDPYYLAYWTPLNQPDWPKALKFTFTLYDSKGIIKGGRRFEHIVYIGK